MRVFPCRKRPADGRENYMSFNECKMFLPFPTGLSSFHGPVHPLCAIFSENWHGPVFMPCEIGTIAACQYA